MEATIYSYPEFERAWWIRGENDPGPATTPDGVNFITFFSTKDYRRRYRLDIPVPGELLFPNREAMDEFLKDPEPITITFVPATIGAQQGLIDGWESGYETRRDGPNNSSQL